MQNQHPPIRDKIREKDKEIKVLLIKVKIIEKQKEDQSNHTVIID